MREPNLNFDQPIELKFKRLKIMVYPVHIISSFHSYCKFLHLYPVNLPQITKLIFIKHLSKRTYDKSLENWTTYGVWGMVSVDGEVYKFPPVANSVRQTYVTDGKNVQLS